MKKIIFTFLFVFLTMSVTASDFHLFFNGAGNLVRSRGYDVYGDFRYEVFSTSQSSSYERLIADYERLYKVTYLQPTPIIFDKVLGYTLNLYRPIPIGTVLLITIHDGHNGYNLTTYVFIIQITNVEKMNYVFFKREFK